MHAIVGRLAAAVAFLLRVHRENHNTLERVLPEFSLGEEPPPDLLLKELDRLQAAGFLDLQATVAAKPLVPLPENALGDGWMQA